ncbi:hypothetical protein EUGRSUZ_I01883 [Eucalyptus grandis]|uniref:Uncharacterized protein n=2 Tax=Eucalyptus grandis TaxID=71139 RepID=A0ACC3JH24_EUCGR|nr:hypothetical protein EUGRSUZ_I01883 [Eucalyptus grandis]
MGMEEVLNLRGWFSVFREGRMSNLNSRRSHPTECARLSGCLLWKPTAMMFLKQVYECPVRLAQWDRR